MLGRDGEAGGSLLNRLRVERASCPLLCTEVALGPAWPTSGGPAGTGGARVLATALLVGRPARAVLSRLGHEPVLSAGGDGARAAACRLGEDAVLLTALGHRLDATRAVLSLVGA